MFLHGGLGLRRGPLLARRRLFQPRISAPHVVGTRGPGPTGSFAGGHRSGLHARVRRARGTWRAQGARQRVVGDDARVPAVSARVRRKAPRRPARLLWRLITPGHLRLSSAFRRGAAARRPRRVRHGLLHALQPALRVLHQLGDLTGRRGPALRRRRSSRAAPSPARRSARLPQAPLPAAPAATPRGWT